VKPKILLVDREENILKQMRWALEPDYEVFTISDEGEAMSTFEKEKPAVVTLDLSLNPHNPADLGGMRLLEQILSQEPSTRAIVVTGNDDEKNALRAVRLGACDYYAKPIRVEELKIMIRRAFHIHRLQQKVQQNDHSFTDGFHRMVGPSKSMKDIFRFIERVAVSDISVLICGESGIGKEMVVYAIHLQS